MSWRLIPACPVALINDWASAIVPPRDATPWSIDQLACTLGANREKACIIPVPANVATLLLLKFAEFIPKALGEYRYR